MGSPASFGGDSSAIPQMIVTALDRDVKSGRDGNSDAYFYVARSNFMLERGIQFDQGPQSADGQWGPGTMVRIPAPQIISSAAGRGGVTLDVSFDDVADGFQGAGDAHATITGYNLCTAAGASQPSREASAWNCSAATTSTRPGGATISGFASVLGSVFYTTPLA